MIRKLIVKERAQSEVKTEPICEVLYDKASEGVAEVESLWRANFDKSYCEKKAKEFVENKLKVNGWDCSIVTYLIFIKKHRKKRQKKKELQQSNIKRLFRFKTEEP